MRYYILFSLLFLFFTGTISPQTIPNAGFENWTDGNPDGWVTDNVIGVGIPVTQSGESHSGASAARLEIINVGGFSYPPTISVLDQVTFSQKPANLNFYYHFVPQGNDAIIAVVLLYKESLGQGIAGGSATIGSGTSGYTMCNIPLEYYSDEMPDNAYIYLTVGDTSGEGESAGTIGSYALIDDFAFEGVTSVEDKNNMVKEFELMQNYPNPFNPETNFRFSIQEHGIATLKIYDVLGNEAAVLLNEEKEPGEYDIKFNASGLASGVYFAKLSSGEKQMIKKILLLK